MVLLDDKGLKTSEEYDFKYMKEKLGKDLWYFVGDLCYCIRMYGKDYEVNNAIEELFGYAMDLDAQYSEHRDYRDIWCSWKGPYGQMTEKYLQRFLKNNPEYRKYYIYTFFYNDTNTELEQFLEEEYSGYDDEDSD